MLYFKCKAKILIYIYVLFFRFFFIIGYHKMLSIVLCAMQQVLVYLFYIQQCVYVNPQILIYLPPHPHLVTVSFFFLCLGIFFLKTVSKTQGFPVAQMVKNLPAMQETRVRSLGQEDPLERVMAIYSSVLAWRILWPEETGGLVCVVAKSWTRLSN